MNRNHRHRLFYWFAKANLFQAFKVGLAFTLGLSATLMLSLEEYSLPLMMGMLAGGLAENASSLKIRVRRYFVSIGFFAFASFGVTLLFPYPLLFAPALMLSTFGLMILSGFSTYFTKVTFGTLLIATYTMIGQATAGEQSHPVVMVLGTAIYGIYSICWQAFFPKHASRNHLAQCYFDLSQYLLKKAEFFGEQPDYAEIRHQLALLNINTIDTIASARESLSHLPYKQQQELLPHFQRVLTLHERILSTQHPYQRFNQALDGESLRHGFALLFEQLAEASTQYGHCLLLNVSYRWHPRLHWMLQAIGDQITLSQQRHANSEFNTGFLALHRNLAKIERELNCPLPTYNYLPELNQPQVSVRRRLKILLNPTHELFRHAVRMSLGMGIGYGMVQVMHLSMGYWILLTFMLVCQPSFSKTRNRLKQRIIGTIAGLLLGIPLLEMEVDPVLLLTLLPLFGFLFFAYMQRNYSLSVLFVTLYVFLSFEMMGGSDASLYAARLIETLLGCCMAVLLLTYVMPSWESQRIEQLLSGAMKANLGYLRLVKAQLFMPGNDTSHYRRLREGAQRADARLARSWQDMLVEPGRPDRLQDTGYLLSTRNHALLSAISAMSANRDSYNDKFFAQQILPGFEKVESCLLQAIQLLDQERTTSYVPEPVEVKYPDVEADQNPVHHTLVIQLKEMERLASTIVQGAAALCPDIQADSH